METGPPFPSLSPFPLVLDSLLLIPGREGSPMTSSDPETDLKSIIIIIYNTITVVNEVTIS